MNATSALLVPFLNRADAFDPADWFQLVPKGSFPIARREGDTVRTYLQVVDDVACSRIVQAFANRQAALPGYKMLVDFEHFSHDPAKSSAAACWVDALQNRADGVWARGTWSDEGEAAIKNRRYRFLSPVWFPKQTEPLGGNRFRPVEVSDAGLTNKPNLGDALVPFWNREFTGREANSTTQPEGNAMKDRLIPLLKMDAGSTEDQVVAQVTAFVNRASELDALKGTHASLQSEHTALKNRHATLLTTSVDRTLAEFGAIIVVDSRDAWKNRLTADYEGTVALLKGLKPAAAAAPDATKIDATLKEFDGVIAAESKDAWKNRLTSDYEGTVALLKGIKKPAKKTPLHKENGAAAAAGANDEHPFMNRVSEVIAERKLDKADAIAAVAGEEPALYADYRETLTGGE